MSEGVESAPTQSLEAITAELRAKEPWPDPLPLTRAESLSTFPVDALPPWAAEYALSLAVFTQTPLEMAASCVLGGLAAITGGKAWVEALPGWVEGTNLYLAVVAPPGTRKSPVHEAVLAPIREHEAKTAESERVAIARAISKRDLAKVKIDSAKRGLHKMKGLAKQQAEQEVLDAAEDLEKTPEPVPYRLVAGDVTPERLIELLAQHKGRLSLLSDEDTVLGHMLGRYSRNPPIEAFLSAFSNKTIDRDRKNGPRIHVERPALTIVTCIQPALLQHARGDALVVGRGLLDRFVFVMPPNLVGRRNVDPPPIPGHVKARYVESMGNLAEAMRIMSPFTIRVAGDASERFSRWRRELERRRGPAGDLSSIQGWAAKADGLTARIAGILHVANGGGIREAISVATMENAVRLCRAFVEHAQASAEELGLDDGYSDARAILVWAIEQERPIVVRELQRELRGRFKKADRARAALSLLEQHHVVRRVQRPTKGRTAEEWHLSPKASKLLAALPGDVTRAA